MKPLGQLNHLRDRRIEAKLGLGPFDGHDDHFGAFMVKVSTHPKSMKVIASRFREHHPQGDSNPPWNHVSVSFPNRTPTWGEMCKIKELFFDPEEVAMQLHPAESDYISNHEYCLHIWQPVGLTIPTPPAIMVGVKDLGNIPHKK